MDFRVPQFIEHDPKILGPLTLSQTMYVGTAFGICFVLYFTLGKQNIFLYVLVSALLIGASLGLAFIKIEGRGIPVVGKNFAVWTVNNKLFLWKRKQAPVFLSGLKQKIVSEEKKEVEPSILKIRQTGKIEGLMKKIDFEK
jgi:hypothetical protein